MLPFYQEVLGSPLKKAVVSEYMTLLADPITNTRLDWHCSPKGVTFQKERWADKTMDNLTKGVRERSFIAFSR